MEKIDRCLFVVLRDSVSDAFAPAVHFSAYCGLLFILISLFRLTVFQGTSSLQIPPSSVSRPVLPPPLHLLSAW